MRAISLFLFVTLLLVTGCQKSEEMSQNNGNAAKVRSGAIISLQGEDNADYSMLTVASADNNQLRINKSLIAAAKDAENFKTGSMITAFTSPKDVVIGKITSINEEGDLYVVDTEPQTVASLFENLDVNLGLNQLADNDAATKSGAGDIVYPVRIISQNENGESKVYSANDPATRASWETRFEYPFAFSVPLSADRSSAISVSNGLVESNITAVLNIKISWFKLKNFEASLQGFLNAKAPLNVKFNLAQDLTLDKDFSTTLSTDKYWSVYKIAGIPLVVNFTPSVKFAGNLKANASADLNIDMGINTQFQVGAYYESGSWSKVAKAEPQFVFDVSGVSEPLQLQGKIGVVPGIELGLFGLVLGKTEVDSYATADINAYVQVPEGDNSGELGVSLKADGYVGGYIDLGLSPLDVMSIYRQDFTIFGPKEITNLSWTQPYSSIGK